MYLVEIKLGDMKIKKYIGNAQILGQLIKENMNNYDYIKILEEIPNEKPKTRKKTK